MSKKNLRSIGKTSDRDSALIEAFRGWCPESSGYPQVLFDVDHGGVNLLHEMIRRSSVLGDLSTSFLQQAFGSFEKERFHLEGYGSGRTGLADRLRIEIRRFRPESENNRVEILLFGKTGSRDEHEFGWHVPRETVPHPPGSVLRKEGCMQQIQRSITLFNWEVILSR